MQLVYNTLVKHLVVYQTDLAEAILNGRVVVDIRLSKKKNVPFGVVSSNDIVLVKQVGKDIIGQFRVKKVITIDGVNSKDISDYKGMYVDTLVHLYGNMDNEKDAKYATVIFIGEVSRFITSPIKLSKIRLRKEWEVLG